MGTIMRVVYYIQYQFLVDMVRVSPTILMSYLHISP